MPTMRSVFSSHIDSIGYDENSREFFVKYQNGKTSVYADVSPQESAEINGSASIGQAIHRILKGRKPHGYAGQ